MSEYNFADELVQNIAVYALITFEDIVMIMINSFSEYKIIQGLWLVKTTLGDFIFHLVAIFGKISYYPNINYTCISLINTLFNVNCKEVVAHSS